MSTLYVQSPTLYLSGAGCIVGATSVTLTSLVDIYGNVLTMADFGAIGYGTFEPDTTNSEAFTFTGVTANANGTYTLTGVKTILAKSPYTQTSGIVRNHSGGTKVVITDNVGFWNTFGNKTNDETLTGRWGTAVAPLAGNDLVNKTYADGLAIAGAPDSSTTTKGITKVSVAPVSATSPIAVGDNDGRVPTQGENDALVGNNTDVVVGTGNKFVTQTGLQHNAEKYAADAGGTDSYAITLSPVPTSYTTGMVVYFKANTANTGAATLNVNSLGAKTIVKGVNTTLDDSDILAGQYCTVIYDGTNFVLQNPVGTNPLYIVNAYKNGTGNSAGTAPTTQTITHGLGRIPKRIQIYATAGGVYSNAQWYGGFSMGSWDSGGQSCVWSGQLNSTNANNGIISKAISIDYYDAGGGPVMRNFTGTIQNVTSTSFDLVGSAVTFSGGSCYYQWQVE